MVSSTGFHQQAGPTHHEALSLAFRKTLVALNPRKSEHGFGMISARIRDQENHVATFWLKL